jgi:hypothetical protein
VLSSCVRKIELVNPELKYKDTGFKLIVCKSCKWCASIMLGIDIFNCFQCNKQKLQYVSISKNERHTINFDNGSINLKFLWQRFRNDRIVHDLRVK